MSLNLVCLRMSILYLWLWHIPCLTLWVTGTGDMEWQKTLITITLKVIASLCKPHLNQYHIFVWVTLATCQNLLLSDYQESSSSSGFPTLVEVSTFVIQRSVNCHPRQDSICSNWCNSNNNNNNNNSTKCWKIIPSQMEVAPLHCTVDITQKRRLFKNTKEIEKM